MPHCIVEYSSDLESRIAITDLMESVFLGALESELFNSSDIKVRAVDFEHFTTGNTHQSFIHITTKILSGRSLEQRKNLSNSILERLNSLSIAGSISITVEVVDIEKESYAKVVK